MCLWNHKCLRFYAISFKILKCCTCQMRRATDIVEKILIKHQSSILIADSARYCVPNIPRRQKQKPSQTINGWSPVGLRSRPQMWATHDVARSLPSNETSNKGKKGSKFRSRICLPHSLQILSYLMLLVLPNSISQRPGDRRALRAVPALPTMW